MKYLWLLLVLGLKTASAQTNSDIILKSRFDIESAKTFINGLRSLLIRNDVGDPYQQRVEKPIVIDLSKAVAEIPHSSQDWISELQSILKIKFFESEYRLVIEDLNYSIEDFNTEILPVFVENKFKSIPNRVQYVTHNYAKGMKINTSSIAFETVLKKTNTKEPIKFRVELAGAEFRVHPDFMMELPMGWFTSILEDQIELNLHQIDLSTVFQVISKKPELIEFYIKDLIIPKVSIIVGNRQITVDQKKLRDFFQKREGELKTVILEVINTRYGNRLSNVIQDSPLMLTFPKKMRMSSTVDGVIDFKRMDVNRSRIINIDMNGHFCQGPFLNADDFCENDQVSAKIRRVIPPENSNRSSRSINRILIEESTNIALSVSEDYLNQLIQGTIRAGLWDDAFKGKDFVLGPEKVFVLAEENGKTLNLYLDIVNHLKGAQRILVGRSELRFPVKLKISLQIEQVKEVPHFRIKVDEMATDWKLLDTGVPEYGLESTVRTVPRFKQKIVAKILEELSSFKNSTLIDIPVPIFKKTYLEEMNFFSDGLGRANATIDLRKYKKKERSL